jgi:Tetratricopeptide repeat.
MKAQNKLLLSLHALIACAVLLAGLTGCQQVPNQTNSPTQNQNFQPVASDSVKEPLSPDQVNGSDADRNSDSTKVAESTDTKGKKGCDNPEKPCGTGCTPVSRLDTGLTFMQMGRFSSAERQFGGLFAADPRDLEAAFYQVWCLMMLSRSEEFTEMDSKTADIRNGSVKGTLMDSWFARFHKNQKLANKLAGDALKKEQSAPCYFTAAISDLNPKNAVMEIDRALKLEPDNFTYILVKGNLVRNTKDFKSAQEWLNKAAKKAPNCELVMLSFGELAQQQGDEKKAVEYFQSALKANPDLNICYTYLSSYYKTRSKVDEVKFYTELLKKYPNHPKVLLDRGRAYYEMLDYDKANADFDTLIKTTEEVPARKFVNALAHMFRGHSYNRTGFYAKAAAEYDLALKYYPNNVDLALSAIGMRLQTQRYLEAEKMLEERLHRWSVETARTAGGDIDKRQRSILLSFKAKIRAEQSRWSETYALANEALRLDPTNVRAYEARAAAYYAEKKYPQALSDYRKISQPQTNDQRGWISTILFNMGKKKEAIAEISAYIKDHPNISMGFSSRANYYMAVGNREKAEADAKAAVKAGVNTPDAHWGLANVYMVLGKREEAAAEVIEALKNDTVATSIKDKLNAFVTNTEGPQALLVALSKKTQEAPTNAQFYFLLGTVQMLANRMDRAEEHLNKAISLNPKVGVYYVQRGILLFKTDRFDEALKDLNKGIDEFKVQDPQGYFARGQVFMNIGQWAKSSK